MLMPKTNEENICHIKKTDYWAFRQNLKICFFKCFMAYSMIVDIYMAKNKMEIC